MKLFFKLSAPAGAATVLLAVILTACDRQPADRQPAARVVVYTSVDEVFARQVLADFERRTGIRVDALYDTEAGKTTGFLRRLEREAARPRCDVWWSSEIFGTIELARAGILEPCDSPAAADIPDAWRDAARMWTATSARARVLAYHTGRVTPDRLPGTWAETAQPDFARRLAIANPQFGTTRGHLAALFVQHGREETAALLQSLRESGAVLADGNAHAVRLLASGQADACWTDTDDVWVAQRRGEPVDLVYPRLAADGPVVWLPCTVALVRDGPNPDAARRLLDFLVGADCERALYQSDSRNIPVRPALQAGLGLEPPLPEPLDWQRVAEALEESGRLARDILLR